ncbi:MAG: MmgE/PrpD family protein [Candidatus Thorarchaeota archaeon]|jgi:2-methylcitrate dehydratase PrpD
MSEQLAEWAGGLEHKDIPSQFIETARGNILDMIGCGLFGSTLPWVRTVCDMVIEWGGKEEATLWGRKVKVPSVNAVFANTNATNSFEFDDTYFPTGIHPGALVVSSAIASSEYKGGATGKELIAAVVAGHEVSARIRSGLGWSVLHGWNGTAICSTFGAAVASAKILGLPPDQIADAIGIAGPYVGGLLTYGFKAGAKRVVNARSGQGGILAALLAEKGVTGYKDFIESKQGGFISAHSSDPTTEKVIENLGKEYMFQNMALKKYPNCTSFHAVLDALYEITGTDPVDVDNLERIVVNTTTGAQKNDVGTTYDNVHSAQMSMPYAVAAKLSDGVVGVEQFSDDKIQDDALRKLAERVEILVDAELDSRGLDHRLAAKVDLVMKTGDKLESSIIRNPRRMTNDEVRKKFYNLATRVVGRSRVDEIVRFTDTLESQDNINTLADLLVV